MIDLLNRFIRNLFRIEGRVIILHTDQIIGLIIPKTRRAELIVKVSYVKD